MSFSFEFHAATKAAAIKATNLQHGPHALKQLIHDHIAHMPHEGPFHVKAHGHVCDGPNSYENGDVHLEIRPIRLLTEE